MQRDHLICEAAQGLHVHEVVLLGLLDHGLHFRHELSARIRKRKMMGGRIKQVERLLPHTASFTQIRCVKKKHFILITGSSSLKRLTDSMLKGYVPKAGLTGQPTGWY